jgi:hypothetical protein
MVLIYHPSIQNKKIYVKIKSFFDKKKQSITSILRELRCLINQNRHATSCCSILLIRFCFQFMQ